MPLFTDALITTLDQLAAQDSAVLNVTSTEGIDVTAKLTLAQNEIGAELVAAASGSPFLPANASMWWPGMMLNSTFQLQNIVITQPLQMWHTFHTLELVYRDAYYSQLNDRYKAKWNEYIDLSKWASNLLFQTGIGMVADPVPIAGVPQITTLSGPFPPAVYFAQVTWLNAGGEEGAPSAITSASAPNDSVIEIHPASPPPNAAGWNVYVGSTVNTVTLQNAAMLNLDQPWDLPTSGLVFGRSSGTGQAPNYFRQIPRYLQRG